MDNRTERLKWVTNRNPTALTTAGIGRAYRIIEERLQQHTLKGKLLSFTFATNPITACVRRTVNYIVVGCWKGCPVAGVGIRMYVYRAPAAIRRTDVHRYRWHFFVVPQIGNLERQPIEQREKILQIVRHVVYLYIYVCRANTRPRLEYWMDGEYRQKMRRISNYIVTIQYSHYMAYNGQTRGTVMIKASIWC